MTITGLGIVRDPSSFLELQSYFGTISPTDPRYGAKGDGVTDDTQAIKSAISNGGYIKFPTGKTFITDALNIPSNTTIDLNGSTLKLKSGVPDYHNVINVGNSGLTTNVAVKNGTIDGNTANQSGDYTHYGVYLLQVDGVYLENLSLVNCDGEGLFIGYTGYLAKNVFGKNIKLSGNTRNDLAITNADTIFLDNVVINSTATNSACVDFELQDNTNTLKNIYLDGFVINSANQPMKMLTNSFTGTVSNINLSNLKFTGAKGLSMQLFTNVKISNLETVAPVEIVGSSNIDIKGFKATGVTGNGLYLYPSTTPAQNCTNITLDDIDISGGSSYGLILQGVVDCQGSNIRTYNNTQAGIEICYNCSDIHLVNVRSTDTRSTGKTQPYGIEFEGTNTGIVLVDSKTDGNLTANYKNYPSVIFELNSNSLRFISPDGSNSILLSLVDNLYNLKWAGQLQAKRFGITQQTANGSANVGEMFEDTDGKFKYVPRAGGLLTFGRYVAVPASATAAGTPGDWSTDGSYYYVCSATNTWRRVAVAAW